MYTEGLYSGKTMSYLFITRILSCGTVALYGPFFFGGP